MLRVPHVPALWPGVRGRTRARGDATTRRRCAVEEQTKARRFKIRKLEERIAPTVAPGLQGYEGQPGNQGG